MLLSVTMADGGDGEGHMHAWFFLGRFMAGRFVAYLTFGLVVGLLGTRMGAFSHWIGTYALIVMSVILMAYGIGMNIPHLGLCRMAGGMAGSPYFPYILGGLTGLNVCPPFLLAIACILQRGVSPVYGMLFFLSFFLASSLYIIPVGFTGFLSGCNFMARVGRYSTVAVGIVFFLQGIRALS